jgi:hypothetical protein
MDKATVFPARTATQSVAGRGTVDGSSLPAVPIAPFKNALVA